MYAIAVAHRAVPPFDALHVVSDSKYVVDGLTVHAPKWEQRGWVGVKNSAVIRDVLALLRSRSAPVTFRWVKGHSGVVGNEGADVLAGAGAALDPPHLPMFLPAPRRYLSSGMALRYATQSLLYRGIREHSLLDDRRATVTNLMMATAALTSFNGRAPLPEILWGALRRDPVDRKVRDYLWKALHSAHRVGKFWTHISGFESRALCGICGSTESMEHILQDCAALETSRVWKLAKVFLAQRNVVIPPLPSFGLYLGAAAAVHEGRDGTVVPGATRLLRLVLTEAAYLVWRLRCTRVIEWSEEPGRSHAVSAVDNMWYARLNQRLRTDQLAALAPYSKSTRVTEHLVLQTWGGTIHGERDLGEHWVERPGVLVGRPPLSTVDGDNG
ncbi:RnaseH-domain-containing protein [Trametes sanguinea]|nr:RnaseH-domain-containing protein [Trametes sanguinea]